MMPRARKKPAAPIEAARVRGISPAHLRRIRDAALDVATDARHGHELGRLALREMAEPGSGISTIQESAGLRYAELRVKWRAVTGIRSPNGSAQDYGRVRGLPGDGDEARAMAVEEAMRDADDVLATAGQAPRRAVEFVCDRDSIIVGYQMLLDLRAGLDALAVAWRMIR